MVENRSFPPVMYSLTLCVSDGGQLKAVLLKFLFGSVVHGGAQRQDGARLPLLHAQI